MTAIPEPRKPKSDIPAGWPVYAVRRFFFQAGSRRIKSGLTLTEAQAWCSDPETSSSTAKGRRARRYSGPWFDGYEVMAEATKRLRRDGYDV